MVDVRRNPISRKYGFSKKTLSDTVQKLGISYLHIPELGIASEKRQNLQVQADYEKLFTGYEREELRQNRPALEELVRILLRDRRIAITCFEAEVRMCHRGRIAKVLSSQDGWRYNVRHI